VGEEAAAGRGIFVGYRYPKMESVFSPEVVGAVIAGLFSLAATIISIRANRKSDGTRDQVVGVKDQVDRVRDQLFELRLEPYRELWSLTELPSQTSEEGLTPELRAKLLDELGLWYHQKGGILLSQEARVLFRQTESVLEHADPEPTAEETMKIRHKMSELRTQIKRDLGFE
jgi:hypothetical protein